MRAQRRSTDNEEWKMKDVQETIRRSDKISRVRREWA